MSTPEDRTIDKRAQGIAALGLVKRDGDKFRVESAALRGPREVHYVWKDDAGHVQCDCADFIREFAMNTKFRCVHILAVKRAISTNAVKEFTEQVQEDGADMSTEQLPEAGCAINFRLVDPDGLDTQITLRAARANQWGEIILQRDSMVHELLENGWTTHGMPLAPKAQSQTTQTHVTPVPSNGQDGTEYEDFDAESLIVSFNPKGDKAFKVSGGKYKKFGVVAWPEVVERMGFDTEALTVGTYKLEGRVRALIMDGKPKKILGFAPQVERATA